MLAGMQKAMLERPILGQIVPAVVFVFPASMPQRPNLLARKGARVQGSDPHPGVLCSLGKSLLAAPVIRGDIFFGADHPHGLRVILAEGDSLGLPELHLIQPPVMPLFKLQAGRPSLKQPHGALVEVAPLLLAGDHDVPSRSVELAEARASERRASPAAGYRRSGYHTVPGCGAVDEERRYPRPRPVVAIPKPGTVSRGC